MKRRTLLAAVAASAGALGSAGCLQGGGAGPDTDRTTDGTTTAEDSTTTDDETTKSSEREWEPSGDPVETFAVGDRDTVSFPDNNQVHAVVLWNRTEREREVVVEYADGMTEELERLGPVAVPADRVAQVDLGVPTHYALTVVVDGEAVGEFEIGREWFDCNRSASRYALGDGELVDYGSISTAAGCRTPEVATTDLTVDSRDCGSEDGEHGIVKYGDRSLAITGTIATPTPCYDLSIVETTYDAKARTARIVVDADEQDKGCVECVGAIDYAATVDYEVEFPDHVELVHRSWDEERLVATASRNADV